MMSCLKNAIKLVAIFVLAAGLQELHGQNEEFFNLTLNDGGQQSPNLVLNATQLLSTSLRKTSVYSNEPYGLGVTIENSTNGGPSVWFHPILIGRYTRCALAFLSDNTRLTTSELKIVSYGGMSPAWLHVDATNTNYPTSHRTLGVFSNDGGAAIKLENVDVQETWDLATLNNGDFRISREGSGGHEFRILRNGRVLIGPGNQSVFDLRPNGNLLIDGTLVQSSDRNKKENFAEVDSQNILDKLARIPVQTWNYKSDADSVRHIGPTAQDFHKQFKLGENDKTISTVDTAGVTIAALQALNQKLENEIEASDLRNRELESRIDELERLVRQFSSAIE